jgi:peptidoglycan hydrolase-like protein with peptidoglycan-binding domain
MRQPWSIIGWLPLVLLTACVPSQPEGPTTMRPPGLSPRPVRPAVDRLLTRGEIQVAESHLRDFGFDPGPIDGLFTAETQAAVRAFQARYGSVVSGQLDYATRLQLLPGLDFQHAAR